ncbi:MAG: molybdenum cofactor biosynthesis protein MoaE [Thioalkalispiraceae bacterium]|jgi:molybdopterin synthase catalytic subunit
MPIQLFEQSINPWEIIQEYEQQHSGLAGRHGANVTFVGRMRDFNEAETISSMQLEHYPGMTEKFLTSIAEEATGKWDIMDVLIVHRVGEISPGDTIVIVVVWAAHRAHAYEANQYIMEALKSRAPFWKKETLADGGARWVEKNTPGKVDNK